MKRIDWLFLFALISSSCTNKSETQIPRYRAKLYKADTVDLRAVAKDKITFLTIWSIFCEPYLKELPELQTLYTHYKSNHQITFVTLALNTEAELTDFTSPTTHTPSMYQKAFNYSGLTRFALPSLIGSRSAYHIEKGNARLSDVKAVNRLKHLFTFDAIPISRIYDPEGKLIFEQRGVDTSPVGLGKYRLHLMRKLDSLTAL